VFHATHAELMSTTQKGTTVARSALGEDVYLHLYHGQKDAGVCPPGQGFDGPKIRARRVVINTDNRLPGPNHNTLVKANCVQLFKADGTVEVINYFKDLLCFEGKYYGDFSVACVTHLSDEEIEHGR